MIIPSVISMHDVSSGEPAGTRPYAHRMRVLHVSWEYPPMVYGGLGRHVHSLAEAQAARGDEVTVLSRSPQRAAAALGVEAVGWERCIERATAAAA